MRDMKTEKMTWLERQSGDASPSTPPMSSFKSPLDLTLKALFLLKIQSKFDKIRIRLDWGPMKKLSLITALSFTFVAGAMAQAIFSSIEQYNFQTDATTTSVRDYEGFDDLSDLPGVTGYTFSVNGGTSEEILPNPEFGGLYKRRLSYATLPEMLAARPVDGTYQHTLSGDPATTVSITAPGISYADAIPIDPLFTITGATGSWSIDEDGFGVFNFDPTDVTSFTLTMNLFATSTLGDAFVSGLSIAEITDALYPIDDISSDIQLNGAAPLQLSVTFTKGLSVEGGDTDPSTFGFDEGSVFEIEGEFVNVFFEEGYGLDDELLAGFVYQNVTAMKIEAFAAVPEPASAGALISLISLGYVALRRRRNHQ